MFFRPGKPLEYMRTPIVNGLRIISPAFVVPVATEKFSFVAGVRIKIQRRIKTTQTAGMHPASFTSDLAIRRGHLRSAKDPAPRRQTAKELEKAGGGGRATFCASS